MKKLAMFLAAAAALGGLILIRYASAFEASMVTSGSPMNVGEYKLVYGLLGVVMMAPAWVWLVISLSARMLFRKL